MWWLFSFYDVVWPLLAVKELASATNIEATVTRFVMLGMIPGTSYQFTFGDMVIAIWATAFVYLTYRLFIKAHKIINQLDPYRRLPTNMTYISLISL